MRLLVRESELNDNGEYWLWNIFVKPNIREYPSFNTRYRFSVKQSLDTSDQHRSEIDSLCRRCSAPAIQGTSWSRLNWCSWRHSSRAKIAAVTSVAKYRNMWLTSQTGADVGSCSRYDWVVGGPECWPPQADEGGKLDPTNCANRCRWFCELLILAEVVLPCTWFSALPRGRSRGFDHFSMWDETLNPSGTKIPAASFPENRCRHIDQK